MPHDLPADTWMDQAERDVAAAEHLLLGEFPAHATVFAHLAVEKALKGMFRQQHGENPPVTHDLRHLADQVELSWTHDERDALDSLSDVSILSLYEPDAPFGHPVSERTNSARKRVADARLLVSWLSERFAADHTGNDQD